MYSSLLLTTRKIPISGTSQPCLNLISPKQIKVPCKGKQNVVNFLKKY